MAPLEPLQEYGTAYYVFVYDVHNHLVAQYREADLATASIRCLGAARVSVYGCRIDYRGDMHVMNLRSIQDDAPYCW